MCLDDLVDQYYLIEATENVAIKMDRKLKHNYQIKTILTKQFITQSYIY